MLVKEFRLAFVLTRNRDEGSAWTNVTVDYGDVTDMERPSRKNLLVVVKNISCLNSPITWSLTHYCLSLILGIFGQVWLRSHLLTVLCSFLDSSIVIVRDSPSDQLLLSHSSLFVVLVLNELIQVPHIVSRPSQLQIRRVLEHSLDLFGVLGLVSVEARKKQSVATTHICDLIYLQLFKIAILKFNIVQFNLLKFKSWEFSVYFLL